MLERRTLLRLVSLVSTISLASGVAGAQIERPPEPAAPAPIAAPTLVPPKLIGFKDATYPPQAAQQGLTAAVKLRLTVDETGHVTDAEVLEPVGNGFDEAAREAALQFVFAPALRGDRPTKARLLYRYDFTLRPVAAAEAPPVAAPTTGNLAGQLLIADVNSPIAGARVTVTLADGQKRLFTTDPAGRFSLAGLPAGRYALTVESEGFKSFQAQEEVVVGEQTELKYRLSPETDELEVTVNATRPPREVTRRTIERREISRIPGTSGDAIRSIENLPGVARPPGLAGVLIVRGSYPNDTQVYVDGSEVPSIFHFGGLRSVLPTEILERIDFYPGNYSARYGRGMGAIVDVGLKAPDTRCKDESGKFTGKTGCFSGLAQVDLIEGRFLLQGPTPVKGWNFIAAGRRSWLDAWIGPVLKSADANIKTLPVYYDYQGILETKPTKQSRLSFRYIGADDRFAAVIDPVAQEPGIGGNLRFGQSFSTAQALYENELSSRVNISTMLSVSRRTLEFGIGQFAFGLKSYPVQFRQELGWRVARGLKVNTGLDYLIIPYEVSVRAPNPPAPGQPDGGPFSTRPASETNESRYGFRQGAYVDAEWQPTARLRVVPGLRFDYARDTRELDVSPRFVTRYDLVPREDAQGLPQRRTTVKGGAGYYYQPPEFQETNPVFGTPGLRSNRALQYALGIEQELTSQIDISVEGFYKDLQRLVVRSELGSEALYTNNGLGSAVGLETLLRYKPDSRFFGWIAYTLSRSVRQNSPSSEQYLIQYDQTHNLTMLGSYRLGRGWEFGARLRVVSGNMATPVRRQPDVSALYAADTGAYVPIEGKPYTQRLPLFHQVDFRLDKRWQMRGWQLGAYLDVYNVYNNSAVEGLSYDYNYARQIYQTGVPFLPSLGVRGEF